jgi:hypothetical protein
MDMTPTPVGDSSTFFRTRLFNFAHRLTEDRVPVALQVKKGRNRQRIVINMAVSPPANDLASNKNQRPTHISGGDFTACCVPS